MSRELREKGTINRRQFVVGTVVTIASTGAWSVLADSHEAPKVSEDDPAAAGLKYVHDATKADAALRQGDHFCNNCQLYSGKQDDEWGPCGIFPGKVVSSKGWCTAWAAKAAS